MTAYLLALLLTAAPCTGTVPMTTPCSGMLVPVGDLLVCAKTKADLGACVAHAARAESTCADMRDVDREAAEVREWTMRRERDAARRRADAMTPADDGPSWWAVIGAGVVGVAVGVVVGVLVTR